MMAYTIPPPPPPPGKNSQMAVGMPAKGPDQEKPDPERCEYCRRAVTGDVCDHCGAPHEPAPIKRERPARPKPIETETIIR